jgi:hypothetical protein
VSHSAPEASSAKSYYGAKLYCLASVDDSVCRGCGSQFKPLLGMTELATFFVEDVICPKCDEFDWGGEAG